MTTKLEELERDIAQLGQHSDEQVASEEAAAERLSEVGTRLPVHASVPVLPAPWHDPNLLSH